MEQQNAWPQAEIAEGPGGESVCLQGQHDMPGARVGGQQTGGARGSGNRTKAGMSLKRRDMSKYDRPINVFGEWRGRRFRGEGCRRNKPKRPNIRCSNQIRGFWPRQTQASYLPCNLSVRAEIGPLFSKFVCERPIKDSVLISAGCFPHPFDNGWRESQAGPLTDGWRHDHLGHQARM